MALTQRIISHTDLAITPFCLGTNVLGWTVDQEKGFEVMDAFLTAGGNFIDTADTYPWWTNGVGHTSEEIIGKWMKARNNRQQIVLATKSGSETGEHPKDISRAHILKSVDGSLQRLQTDHIDLYYTHFDDEQTPMEEVLEAYNEVIKAGKVRYIAASNLSPARLREAFDLSLKDNLPRYVALQPHYNLMEREKYESLYAPFAETFNLSVFPYWPLASGFLTGKYRDEGDLGKSVRGGSVSGYMNEKGFAMLKALDEVAARHQSTPAAVSLAWLLAQPHIDAPISSVTSLSQLNTSMAALHLELTKEDIALLNEVSG